ncbi:unnamed protein product [Heligmosomoides polygyrus]|uniref:Leucine Rich repeat-containing domain protein n=1 Tax=Heligmosomoides polygyrus TaxID=6339 RepID=A0A183FW32_HELPZ|nr:unnamed protein product [Heligmosomoides polygyrus]
MIRVQFLKLEGCELSDRYIFNVPEINCKVKYLCLRDNKFTKPWQLLSIRFPLSQCRFCERVRPRMSEVLTPTRWVGLEVVNCLEDVAVVDSNGVQNAA